MTKLRITACILFIVISAADAAVKPTVTSKPTPHPKFDCTEKKNGLYIGGCTTFYQCENKTTVVMECPDKLVVNKREMWCDYEDKIAPPCGKAPECTDLIDGNHADMKRKCRFYYSCLRGEFKGYSRCPGALVYDNEKDACDWDYLVKKPCGKRGPANQKPSY